MLITNIVRACSTKRLLDEVKLANQTVKKIKPPIRKVYKIHMKLYQHSKLSIIQNNLLINRIKIKVTFLSIDFISFINKN